MRSSRAFGACLVAASVVTVVGYLLFRGGLRSRAALLSSTGAFLIAPGSFVVFWIPESPFAVWNAVLLVSNTTLWAAVLYMSVLVLRKLRHAPGKA
jgi:hypothetical protein